MTQAQARRARSQEDRRARLLRAAAKRASLRHPHVLPARLVDGDKGRSRLALQPCSSPSLRAVLERGPLSTKNAVALIVGLASAVEAFARAGLVARELNPDAVLVHPRRGAILTDYGIPAGLIGPAAVRRDAHGAYRSPEEREGRELTARSSVYSLGAILVSALTAAPAPEQLGPQQARFTRDVPPTIGSVIAQAMAADPNRRYADVTQMARAAVEVVRASERIGRMQAPAPRKQKPSRAVRWRAAQQPGTRGLSLVAPVVTRNAAGPATAPAEDRAEVTQRKAAQDAERREKAEHAAQRKVAQDAERREKAEEAEEAEREQAAAKRERDEAAKRARETAAQNKRKAAAAKRERDEAAKRERAEAAAKRKREEAAAKRKAAVRRAREKAAAKQKREQDAKHKREQDAEHKREQDAGRKAGAAAKSNGAPATRRRGATESGRQRKPRRGATAKSPAAAPTSARAGAPTPNLKVGHRLPLLGIAIVAGAAGVSALALSGGGSEGKAVRISAGDLSIRVPAGWERVAPPAPRLEWLSGTLGAAASDGGRAALVSGLIRDPTAGRRGLRALLPDGVAGKTVRLGGIEAVRYSELRLGTGTTAYVIHTTGPSIAMICRGPTVVARQCAEAGATVALRGERPISPAAAARRPLLVRRAVRTLSVERAAGRRLVAKALVADDQAKASRGLQASYLQAAGRVDLSGAYGPSIEALSAALRKASGGYGDLAESISAGDQGAYDAARAAVLEAEIQVWGESAAN